MKKNDNTLEICIKKIKDGIEDASDEWETLSNIEKSLNELKKQYLEGNTDKSSSNIAKVLIEKIEQEINNAGDEWESIAQVENYLKQMESEMSPKSKIKKSKP